MGVHCGVCKHLKVGMLRSTHDMNRSKASVLRVYVNVGVPPLLPTLKFGSDFSSPSFVSACCFGEICRVRAEFCPLLHFVDFACKRYKLVAIRSCIHAAPDLGY